MGDKKLRWLFISGLIIFFIIVAFLQKEDPQLRSMTEETTAIKSKISPSRSIQNPMPASLASVQPPTLLAQQETIHIVQSGETLFSIAQQHNVDIQAIAKLNMIQDPGQIMVGQEIKIPGIAAVVEKTAVFANPAQPTAPTAQPTIPFIQTADTLNGIPRTAIINLSPETRQHIDAIYHHGQEIGRNPDAFSKLGDSTIMAPGLLVQFDQGAYNLGDFAYLQPVIDHYSGSFERYGAATHVGLHAWTVFDPMIADNTWCHGNENVLACELRLHNPSILFIRLGSNDAGIPESFDQYTRSVVQSVIDNGVIPIIGTKADRFEGEENINNQLLRQIAVDYHVPLWDFDLLAATLPNRGLAPEDNVHIDKTTVTHDYTQPTAYQSGQAMQDLSALLMLEAIWQEVNN
jgi:LysM repeat protein